MRASLGGGDARPVADILVDIGRNAQDILHSEICLAQVQVREQLASAQSPAALVAIGAGGCLLSAFFVLLAVVFLLRLAMPLWAAALAVGAVLAVIAAVILRTGLRRLGAVRLLHNPQSAKESAR